MILTILGLGLSCLLGAYISNEVNINDYESGRYSQNVLAFLGFTELYIRYYNEGNIYYKQENYENVFPYIAYIPENLSDSPSLLIQLHGAGERGNGGNAKQ